MNKTLGPTDNAPMEKTRNSMAILGIILVCGTISALFWFWLRNLPLLQNYLAIPESTDTTIPSPTSTASSTPTILPTNTRSPTRTATPIPGWAANFADPILAEIATRPPDMQDNFDDNSGGWRQLETNPCGQRIQVLDGELVFTDCCGNRPNMAYSDFVLELDARFLPETKSNQAAWYVQFRDGIYFLKVDTHGLIYFVTDGKERIDLEIPTAAKSRRDTNHLLLIAKGAQIAFYINGVPFYHTNHASYTTQKRIVIGCWGESPTNLSLPCVVAFDNFKIWDITDLP